MKQQSNVDDPKSTITEYIEACRVGSVNRLQAIFHPKALMAGFFQGEYYMGSPEPFYDEVKDNPAPVETGTDYKGKITTVEISGDVASITLKETGYLNTNFTNWFHLAKLDGDWKIICKAYQEM
jgi:hypothetical protein